MPLIDSYRDLITSQHRGKPNYMATVTALLKHSEDIFSLGIYFYDYAITSNGTLYPDYTNSTYYLRPVINLKANTTATKDANGYYIVD